MSSRPRIPVAAVVDVLGRRALIVGIAALTACGHGASRARELPPPVPEVEPPKTTEPAPYHAALGRGATLYLPPSFAAKKDGYDLIVHFHGEQRWQEANVAHAALDVAVVSVNLGVGTEPYANAFKTPDAFDRLLASVDAEVTKSGRAGGGSIRRIALSAWSAGFSSIARILTPAVAERVDAILLADGFFTFFTDAKKRVVNRAGLEKFASFANSARRGEKLFAITHTTIPTGPYPSTQECVGTLLDMLSLSKTANDGVGPRAMHQIYVVDDGSFHVRGFEGTTAPDHVKQLQAMGEISYPWLKTRWDEQDRTRAGR